MPRIAGSSHPLIAPIITLANVAPLQPRYASRIGTVATMMVGRPDAHFGDELRDALGSLLLHVYFMLRPACFPLDSSRRQRGFDTPLGRTALPPDT